jgi:hypothetical protein
MRNIFLIASLLFIISCGKDEVNPIEQNSGILKDYLDENPNITILKTEESSIPYGGGFATYRGFIFIPMDNIKVTAVGGMIAKQGSYVFELYKLDEYGVDKVDTILTQNISIRDVNKFEYYSVSKQINLSKNERYLIRYFNESHKSVYDAGLGYFQPDMENLITFPVSMEDILIAIPYYSYHWKNNNEYLLHHEGSFDRGIFRGLVDFKYELVE